MKEEEPKVGDIVYESEYKKIVIRAIDKDQVLYAHIGKGKGGFEWSTGVLVVEDRKKK